MPESTKERLDFVFSSVYPQLEKVTQVIWVKALSGYQACLTSPQTDFKIAVSSDFVFVQVWVCVSVSGGRQAVRTRKGKRGNIIGMDFMLLLFSPLFISRD